MDALLLIAVLAINVFVSWRNCVAIGGVWKDTVSFGSILDKVLLWCGVVQSWIGFSLAFILPIGWMAMQIAAGTGNMHPHEVAGFWDDVASLWYLAIIFPALGTGTVVWLESLRYAYHRRDFGSLAGAGWNTFAQVHNTLGAFRNIGPAVTRVGGLFKPLRGGRARGKGAAVALVVIVVILALMAGGMVTFALIRRYAATRRSRLEIHENELRENEENGVYASGESADGSFRYTMG